MMYDLPKAMLNIENWKKRKRNDIGINYRQSMNTKSTQCVGKHNVALAEIPKGSCYWCNVVYEIVVRTNIIVR